MHAREENGLEINGVVLYNIFRSWNYLRLYGRESFSSAKHVQKSVWKYSKTRKLESGSEVKGT